MRDADERLDGGLLHARDFVLRLKDVIRRLHRRVHVAQLDVDVRGDVARRVAFAKRYIVRLVVDDRRARFHGVAGIEDEGQFLVFHFDQRQGALGDFLGLGGHRGNPVAHETHLAIQADEIQRAGDRVGLARRGMHDAGDILIGQHRMDAGQRARLAHVNVLDEAVRDGAVEQLADQHAAHLHVGHKGRLALHQFDGVHLGFGRADVLRFCAHARRRPVAIRWWFAHPALRNPRAAQRA